LSALILGGCSHSGNTKTEMQPAQESSYSAQQYKGSLEPDDGQWIRPAKDYASTRYSTLDQINQSNVKNLKVAWTFSTGMDRGHEAAPLYVNGTLYIITPWPNTLFALDAKTGALKWQYSPNPSPSAKGVACCDWINRGGSYAFGNIYYNTLDGFTVAVNAQTGQQVYKTKIADITQGETITMAALVVKDKVLVGNSGGEFGVRGALTAVDAHTGKIAWKAYSAGSDKDCLIGRRFKPFYNQDKGQDLGIKSWPPDGWKIGGASVWGWISYDPATNLIFYGTSNPGPWNSEERPGDNKWSAGHVFYCCALSLCLDWWRGFSAIWSALLLDAQDNRSPVERSCGQVALLAFLYRIQPDIFPNAYSRIERDAAPCLYLSLCNALGKPEPAGQCWCCSDDSGRIDIHR
jgi:lanthanide-dependent methanol dehydrogenase